MFHVWGLQHMHCAAAAPAVADLLREELGDVHDEGAARIAGEHELSDLTVQGPCACRLPTHDGVFQVLTCLHAWMHVHALTRCVQAGQQDAADSLTWGPLPGTCTRTFGRTCTTCAIVYARARVCEIAGTVSALAPLCSTCMLCSTCTLAVPACFLHTLQHLHACGKPTPAAFMLPRPPLLQPNCSSASMLCCASCGSAFLHSHLHTQLPRSPTCHATLPAFHVFSPAIQSTILAHLIFCPRAHLL